MHPYCTLIAYIKIRKPLLKVVCAATPSSILGKQWLGSLCSRCAFLHIFRKLSTNTSNRYSAINNYVAFIFKVKEVNYYVGPYCNVSVQINIPNFKKKKERKKLIKFFNN